MTTSLNPLLGYAAGALTILSPCVLPLVPIVLAGAAQRGRWAPLALAGGLVASFTLTGFLLALLGAQAGFDGEGVRLFGAIILALAGLVLLVPALQRVVERAAALLRAGPEHARTHSNATALPDRRRSARCSGWYGAPVSARRSVPPLFSPHRDRAWGALRR